MFWSWRDHHGLFPIRRFLLPSRMSKMWRIVMLEVYELTGEELDAVAGGVSLGGTSAAAFTGGIGTSTSSSATTSTSTTNTVNGGSVGAASLASFTLAASPPGS